MEQMHCHFIPGQTLGKNPCRFNGAFGRRRMVDGNEDTPQPDVAADLTDKASCAGRNKQRRNGCATKYRFRDRAFPPMLKSVTPMRGEHDKVGGMLVEKAGNPVHDVLVIEPGLDDTDAELVERQR